MGTLLDIVGSFITGTLVLSMVFAINMQMRSTSIDSNEYSATQRNSVSMHQTVLDDFFKIGYRNHDNAIILAEQNRIKFIYDVNNDLTKDSVYYYMGLTSELAVTPNNFDRILYRKVNNSPAENIGVVISFKLNYFDSLGTVIPYSALTTQAQRNMISAIQVYFKTQNSFSTDSTFREIEWQRTVIPKNIN